MASSFTGADYGRLRPDTHVAWRGPALEGRGQALARLVTGNSRVTAVLARSEVRKVAGRL